MLRNLLKGAHEGAALVLAGVHAHRRRALLSLGRLGADLHLARRGEGRQPRGLGWVAAGFLDFGQDVGPPVRFDLGRIRQGRSGSIRKRDRLMCTREDEK